MNIPKEIQKKIEDYVNTQWNPKADDDYSMERKFTKSDTEFGYTLSLERMKEQEKEIERLKAFARQHDNFAAKQFDELKLLQKQYGEIETILAKANLSQMELRNQVNELKAEKERLKEALSDSSDYLLLCKPYLVKQGVMDTYRIDDLIKRIKELLTPKKP